MLFAFWQGEMRHMLREMVVLGIFLVAASDVSLGQEEIGSICVNRANSIKESLANDDYKNATDWLLGMDFFCVFGEPTVSTDAKPLVKEATKKIFEWADRHNNGDAFGRLALALMNNGTNDYTQILALERGAALGDEYSALRFGDKYFDGDRRFGIIKDRRKAAGLYKIATAKGHFGEAMGRLAQLYLTGDGVLQDYAEAMRLLKAAVADGDSNSMTLLGSVWREGRGVEINNQKAYVWYSLAVENINRTQPSWAKDATYQEAQRDTAAAALDTSALLNAQAIAKRCLASGYKDCGD